MGLTLPLGRVRPLSFGLKDESHLRMRIGVTYDLRADYLAMGMSEEESAEFDAEITIESLCKALSGLGYEPVRIGHIRALTERLVKGERWDAVFNICEGVQ